MFVHGILGCDTSRIFGIGKGQALKKIYNNEDFRQCAEVFQMRASVVEKHKIIASGEKALLCLYNCKDLSMSLDEFRYQSLCKKVAVSNQAVEIKTLPPKSEAVSSSLLPNTRM